MREIFKVAKQGLRALSSHGKKVLTFYLASLIVIASLDGVALVLISKLLDAKNSATSFSAPSSHLTEVASSVVLLFVLRSAFSSIATWVSLREFAQQEVEIGQNRFAELQELPFDLRVQLSESDVFTLVDRSPTNLVQGFLVSVVTIVAETFSALVILGVAFKLQPVTAIVASTYFVTIAVLQNKFLSSTQHAAGSIVYKSGNATYDLLGDYYHLNKLLQVTPSDSLQATLRSHRENLALARARQSFIASLPRYFMESMLALGFLVIGAATWLISGSASVIPALAVFGAAGFRMLPSVNRIQGLFLSAIGYLPLAQEALKPIQSNESDNDSSAIVQELDPQPSSQGNTSILDLTEVFYAYPGATQFAVSNVNLNLEMGKRYAIVGPSGSGKTSLVDICLGLLKPQKGSLKWASSLGTPALGYVPQETYLSSASIAGNVALEWEASHVDIAKVKEAIEKSQLSDYFGTNQDRIDLTQSVEQMSGGQKQRLGLARALYQNASFLVLDEATSALDSLTELQVMDTVRDLHGDVTVLVVAHRLSTVKDADEILYMEDGQIIGRGTFATLAKTLPQFSEQIRIGSLEFDG